MNRYQEILASNLAGNVKDCTWNRLLKIHECCGSRTDWRHKENCIQVIGSEDEIGNEKWKALDRMDKNAYIDQIFAF